MPQSSRSTLSRTVLRFARYAWASPATLVGLALAALSWMTGATARRVDGVCEVGGGAVCRVIALLPKPMRFEAITLGHVVIGVDHAALAACRAHEHVHVRQYERWGFAFFPLYLAASLIAYAAGRDPYRHNRFEQEAFAQTTSARRRSEVPTDGA